MLFMGIALLFVESSKCLKILGCFAQRDLVRDNLFQRESPDKVTLLEMSQDPWLFRAA